MKCFSLMCVPQPQTNFSWRKVFGPHAASDDAREALDEMDQLRLLMCSSQVSRNNEDVHSAAKNVKSSQDVETNIEVCTKYMTQLQRLANTLSRNRTITVPRPPTYQWSSVTKRKKEKDAEVTSSCLAAEQTMCAYRLAALHCLSGTKHFLDKDYKQSFIDYNKAGSVLRSMFPISRSWTNRHQDKKDCAQQDFRPTTPDALAMMCSAAIDHVKMLNFEKMDDPACAELVALSYKDAFHALDRALMQENALAFHCIEAYTKLHWHAVKNDAQRRMEQSKDNDNILRAYATMRHVDSHFAHNYYTERRTAAVQQDVLRELTNLRNNYSYVIDVMPVPSPAQVREFMPAPLKRTQKSGYEQFSQDALPTSSAVIELE